MTRIPSPARAHALLLACLLLLAAPMHASESAGTRAEDVVRCALAQASRAERLAAALRRVDAATWSATRRDLPTIDATHDHVFGNTNVGYAETSLLWSLPVDLSGRRPALRQAGKYLREETRAEAQVERADIARELREAYFVARHAELRRGTLLRWAERLDAAIVAAQARQRRADSSAFVVARLQRERAMIAGRVALEAARAGEALAALQTMAPCGPVGALVDPLLPDAGLAQPQAPPPELVRLQAAAAARDAERRGLGQPILRGLRFGVGMRRTQMAQGTGYGFLLALSLPIGGGSHDDAPAATLDAERDAIRAEMRLHEARRDAGLAALQRRIDAARAALEQVPESDPKLQALAERAYAAGEASLVDVLDTYRSEAELRQVRLDLELAVRRASIAYDRLQGGGDLR